MNPFSFPAYNGSFSCQDGPYDRDRVQAVQNVIFLFEDNLDRTRGNNPIPPMGWYALTFGREKRYPDQGTDVIRGLHNALPVSTLRRNLPQQGWRYGRWYDENILEFKDVIDKEFDYIKTRWGSGQYTGIIIPEHGLATSGYAAINKFRTPLLHAYLMRKIRELNKLVTGNDALPAEISEIYKY